MRYFGTDGIRGVASDILAKKLPYYLGVALSNGGKVLVGRDVRAHSRDIENMLVNGLLTGDCEPCLAGVVPTPALSYLMKEEGARYAVMITASHNPPAFNGLKVFFKGGKLSARQEEALDKEVSDLADMRDVPQKTALQNIKSAHRVRILQNACERYKKRIISLFPSFEGERVLLDLAHGCMAQLAKDVFEALGAKTRAINDVRDGDRVNVNCGSTHMEALLSNLKEGEIGFAFDGDGDRVLAAVDGKIYDGDAILLALASLYQAQGKLKKRIVVGTSLSSAALQRELTKRNVALLRADVGDKNVLDAMLLHGAILGGEKSGHILALDRANSGDGLVSALSVLEAKRVTKLPAFTPYPFVEIDIPSPRPQEERNSPAFLKKEETALALFKDDGRFVVRPSGTEPFIRVYFECFKPCGEEIFDKIKAIFYNDKINS